MRQIAKPFLVLGALLLVWPLAGCGGNNQAPSVPPAGTDTGPGGAPAASAAALGTEQTAGPFQVTLATEPTEPKAGETRFEATVSRNGEPVTNATVNLELSMPSMKMMGPEVTLDHTEGGEYAGTAKLTMGGEWQAKTAVSAGGETGTAVYEFTASQ